MLAFCLWRRHVKSVLSQKGKHTHRQTPDKVLFRIFEILKANMSELFAERETGNNAPSAFIIYLFYSV